MTLINFIKVSSSLLKRCLNNNKIQNISKYSSNISSLKSDQKSAQKHNQNLVIDLSFEDLMTTEECHRLAFDLSTIYSINSRNRKEEQFNISLCNSLPNISITIEYLRHYLPKLDNFDNFRVSHDSYLHLFDAQRLVYLSPDARDLIEFNPNDVYIMGGIVRKKIFKRESTRITYNKAKREGLRIGRFPIDHLVNPQMKRGVVLFLPQVFNILNDIKSGQTWDSAANKNIPDWKLRNSRAVTTFG